MAAAERERLQLHSGKHGTVSHCQPQLWPYGIVCLWYRRASSHCGGLYVTQTSVLGLGRELSFREFSGVELRASEPWTCF